MPTTKQTPAAPDLTEEFQPLQKYNERMLDITRKAHLSLIETQDAAFQAYADFQDSVASSTQVPWIADAVRAQAKTTRDASQQYVEAARELVK